MDGKQRKVLIVGLQPELIDFSSPDYAAFPGLTAEKVLAGLNAGADSLRQQGYDTDICLTDFGATADQVLRHALTSKQYDCVLVGAGVRTVQTHFLLFERIMNTIHEYAPSAKICFNTKPDDTADAVRRWL